MPTMNRAMRRKLAKGAGSAPRRMVDETIAFRLIRSARARASDAPMDPTQLRDLAIGYHTAFAAIAAGAGTEDDCNALAIASNISLLLCEQGIGGDEIEAVRDSQDLLTRMLAVAVCSGHVEVNEQEVAILRELIALHEAQLSHEACTEGAMVRAIDEIKARKAAGRLLKVTT